MGNGKRLYSIALALSVLIFFFLNSISSVASAKEITVNDDFEADFLSIQEAVNSSSAGDVVLVSPGIYNESVDINTQNISVLSDSGDPEDTVVRDFKLSVNNITVSGFSIQEGLNLQGYKLPNNFNYYRVENCTVKNNRFLEQGIHATECYNSTIAKNVFLGNESGITVEGDNSTISDNIVVDGSISTSLISRYSILINNTLLNGGIGLGGYRNKLIGNNISCTEGECGICLSESSSNIIDNNSVSSAYYGIMMPFFCGDNQITNNTLTSNAVGILIAHYSSGSVIKNNTISNNSIGISLDDYALVTGNRIELNKECGIYLEHSGDVDGCSGDGLIYNNFFNNTVNLFNSTGVFDSSDVADSAVLNTTKTPGINIVGGPYQGGNFWAKPDGTGFSQICADADGDGIGDLPYNINGSEIDYLPLVSVSRSQESIIPVANFSTNITQNLAPVSVQFTDFSKNAVAWNWDFDNDEISDSINQNPAYLYTTSGTYIVNLTVSNGKDTSSKNMKIIVKKAEVPPVAEFKTNITNGQVPLSVQFTDLSKNATSRSWDFNNDGISDSIEKNPVYVYTYPGAYTLTLQ